MPDAKTIEYKGVTIEVWEQSIRCGGLILWLRRPVEDTDIVCIKSVFDAGRAAMAEELRGLRKQKEKLLEE